MADISVLFCSFDPLLEISDTRLMQMYQQVPQLVLLMNCLPDTDLCALLLKYASKNRLEFIRGDAASPVDLSRRGS